MLSEGLWKYSRHPNYFGEASFWAAIGAVGFAAAPDRSWIALWGGALVMLAFFRLSAHLTDQRMLEHRGENYRKVCQEVSALVPMPRGRVAAML